jgi:hypothetical protein
MHALPDCPKTLRDTAKDARALHAVLGQLLSYLDDDATSAGITHPLTTSDLEVVLHNCIEIFGNLDTIVNQYKEEAIKAETSSVQRIPSTWKKSQIESLQKQLAAHRATLNIAVSVANQ